MTLTESEIDRALRRADPSRHTLTDKISLAIEDILLVMIFSVVCVLFPHKVNK